MPNQSKPSYMVLSLIVEVFCPTGKEQAGFSNYYNQLHLQPTFTDDKDITIKLIEALYDALRSGNWPEA